MHGKLRKALPPLKNLLKRNSNPLKGSIAQIGPDSLELQITNIGKGSAEEITVNFSTREFEGS
jgi:hypothetical protein